MELTPANLEAMWQTYNFAFQGAYGSQETWYQSVATELPSSSERQLYPFLKMIPTLREWLGPRTINNLSASNYSLTNKHWELSVGVDKDRISDDTYGVFTPGMAMMGQQMKEWKDRETARVIEAGESELCFDGQNFFDTDHPVDLDNSASGTQSNLLVGSSYDLTADPIKAYRLVRAAMAKWKREDGLQLGVRPDILMVGPDLEAFALQVQDGLMIAQTIKNVAATDNVAAAGVTNVYAGRGLSVIVNPFLTATSGNPFYLLCTKRVIKPFIWQNRQEATLVPMIAPTDPNVFFMREFVYGADIRGAAGVSFPFLAFKGKSS